jgi:hypothetical protein
MRRIYSDAPLTPTQKSQRRYEKHHEAEVQRNKDYHQNNREKINLRYRNHRHGITQDWLDKKMLEQEGKCAICRKPFEKTPHIDHNHKCCPPSKSCEKCRRGLLCDDCNLGLGRFKDDIHILLNAIEYVKKWTNEGHSTQCPS